MNGRETKIQLKRVYDAPEKKDGFRILSDRLWPRGMKKEEFKYDSWIKDLAPSTELREWYHQDEEKRWDEFVRLYKKELDQADAWKTFSGILTKHPVITLLFASKNTAHNQAVVLKEYMEEKIRETKNG
jgi:uncharacterized protein YeaO (DUF488 family)